MIRIVTIATAAIVTFAMPTAAPSGSLDATGVVRQGRYLAAIAMLEKSAFDPDGGVKDRDDFQLWSQYLPFATNELPVHALDARFTGAAPNRIWAAQIARATPREAIATIVERARRTNIVILNEAHYSPRDRAFALEVARALRPLGYAILAAETFDGNAGTSAMERLRRDDIVRFTTGVYTLDPVFAGFVREAVAMGYEPVAYEQTAAQRTDDGGIAEREEAQATNLMAHVFTARRHAKALIFVGFSHVAETAVGDGEFRTEFMAARLKRKTGIDPLTIDQTTIVDLKPDSRLAYDAAASRIGDRPAVFFKDGRPLVLRSPGVGATAVDLQVVHPRRAYRDGRPTWLAALGGRPLAIPAALLPTTGRRLIQAFAANAPGDAVPLDQVLVEPGRPAPMLMVRPQRIRFAIQTAG